MKIGQLFVVATPIGHLSDITLRALDILKSVDRIAAEDTRHSLRLLSHYGIKKPLISYHQFNESARVEQLLSYLRAGEDIALLSDAGTPLISDPGFPLVRRLADEGVSVSPIPGACAAISALSVSGLPTDCFYFAGFLPVQSEKRKAKLSTLGAMHCTVVLYESRHRILSFLTDLRAVLGDEKEIVIARELTKTFETIYRGSAMDVQEQLTTQEKALRGEFVVLLAGATVQLVGQDEEAVVLLRVLLKECSVKQSVQLAHNLLGMRKNKLYALALNLSE